MALLTCKYKNKIKAKKKLKYFHTLSANVWHHRFIKMRAPRKNGGRIFLSRVAGICSSLLLWPFNAKYSARHQTLSALSP